MKAHHRHRSSRLPSWRRLRREIIGTPPGSLAVTAPDTPTHIHVITFAPGKVEEEHLQIVAGKSPLEVPRWLSEPEDGVRWINVVGVHDGELLRELGTQFRLHPLLLEDIQHTEQRPKFQETADTFFAVLRMISWRQQEEHLDVEQVALYAVDRTVISFQEREGDVFDGIRERIRSGRGRVRRSGVDYLFYAIVDAVIDTAFLVVDEIQEQIEQIEELILSTPQDTSLSLVHHLRGETIAVRRALRPLREMLQTASKGDYAFFAEQTYPFLEDSYDHALAIVDSVDAQMDRITGLFQLHSSMLGSSTNEVMRVLTIIATIFIPLTFVAGIYGMNFAVMPELGWRYGYPAVMSLMAVIGAGMVIYFRRRKWF